MATHLSQDPQVEPDSTVGSKLRAAATMLERTAAGRLTVPEGLSCARWLLDAAEAQWEGRS
jgi:hypothetical protein